MKKLGLLLVFTVALLVIGGFILVGCGTSGPELADCPMDIVGTWKRVGGSQTSYCQVFNDGTWICADTLEEIDRKEGFQGQYWFEGTRYFEQDSRCPEAGVYEIHMQPGGYLKYVMIEDECEDRVLNIAGGGPADVLIEWERVR